MIFTAEQRRPEKFEAATGLRSLHFVDVAKQGDVLTLWPVTIKVSPFCEHVGGTAAEGALWVKAASSQKGR